MQQVKYKNILFTAESRKRFKTYVNILSTIKNEGDEKFLVLRRKYFHDCPTEETYGHLDHNKSTNSQENDSLPLENRADSRPPPYKLPPMVSQNKNYKLCVDEFKHALNVVENSVVNNNSLENPLEIISESPKSESKFQEIENIDSDFIDNEGNNDQCKIISVREATRKFNRIASQDDSNKIGSPSNTKQSGAKNVSSFSQY